MSQLISSCYAYTWDIKMDWGLLDRNAPAENRYLREEIVYSSGVSAKLFIIRSSILYNTNTNIWFMLPVLLLFCYY